MYFFQNGPFRPLFLYFCLYFTVYRKQVFNMKVCLWLDSNCGPLVSEATALPTEPQPLPLNVKFYLVDGSKRHHENCDEKVSDGEAKDEIVGHALKVPLEQDGRNHEHVAWNLIQTSRIPGSVTSKKSPNVYKSCPKMISLEVWNFLTTLQKLPKIRAIWAK